MRRASSAAAAARFFAVLSYLFRPFAWVLLRRRATRHGTDPSEGGRLFSGTPTTGRRRSKRLSKDETKWLFPHRIDPLLNDDNDEIVRRVRSGRSERSCHVWFENGSNENVRMFWIDYDGNHQPYKLLSPGQKHRQQTYLTHPWTFRTVFGSEEEEEHLDRNGASEDVEERNVPMRMVIHDSPVFYPPPETVDLEEEFDMEEGDMAPSYAGRANAEVFSITYPKTVTNWSPKSNKTLECYQSEAFQSAVRETLRVWMFAHAKQEEEEEQQQQQQRKETREETAGSEPCQSDSNIITRANHTKTTLSDIPKDVLINEIIRRFAPEPPYYNLMLCT